MELMTSQSSDLQAPYKSHAKVNCAASLSQAVHSMVGKMNKEHPPTHNPRVPARLPNGEIQLLQPEGSREGGVANHRPRNEPISTVL